jgi:hypothetical protein
MSNLTGAVRYLSNKLTYEQKEPVVKKGLLKSEQNPLTECRRGNNNKMRTLVPLLLQMRQKCNCLEKERTIGTNLIHKAVGNYYQTIPYATMLHLGKPDLSQRFLSLSLYSKTGIKNQ